MFSHFSSIPRYNNRMSTPSAMTHRLQTPLTDLDSSVKDGLPASTRDSAGLVTFVLCTWLFDVAVDTSSILFSPAPKNSSAASMRLPGSSASTVTAISPLLEADASSSSLSYPFSPSFVPDWPSLKLLQPCFSAFDKS